MNISYSLYNIIYLIYLYNKYIDRFKNNFLFKFAFWHIGRQTDGQTELKLLQYFSAKSAFLHGDRTNINIMHRNEFAINPNAYVKIKKNK